MTTELKALGDRLKAVDEELEEVAQKAEVADEKIAAAMDAASTSATAATATLEAVTALTGKVEEGQAAVEEEMKGMQADIKQFASVRKTDLDTSCGYKSHREFLNDVMGFGMRKGMTDRLKLCKTVGTDEALTTNDPSGGFLIPEGLLPEILKTDPMALQNDIGAMTTTIPMGVPTVQINARVDKDHSTSVTGGFRLYRAKEADTVESSKALYEQVTLKTEKLMGISYATSEIMQYSPQSFSAIIQAGFADEYKSVLNGERIRGSGVGEYLGILNSSCLITIAKETSQTGNTIVGANILKMRARVWGYDKAVWVLNQDAYVSIASAHIAGTNGDVFLFRPGNGVDVPDTLLGRPVIWDENASTLGSVGDIMCCNWAEYLEGQIGGARFDESVHVRFIYDESAFRFAQSNAGSPWWRTALTPKNSAATLSPFVTLAVRVVA